MNTFVTIPTTNKQVWKHPSPGTVWSECLLQDEVREWLNARGMFEWYQCNNRFGKECNSRGHLSGDIEFWDPNTALLFKLTWGGDA